jgi:hypothetical protein
MSTIITDGEANRVQCDQCGVIVRARPWDHETAMKPEGWVYDYRPAGRGKSLRIMLCPACAPPTPSRYVACVRTDDPDREGWKMIVCKRCAAEMQAPTPHDVIGMLPTSRCERCARSFAEVQQ